MIKEADESDVATSQGMLQPPEVGRGREDSPQSLEEWDPANTVILDFWPLEL